MKATAIILTAGICAAATPACAQEQEPQFAAFDVSQSPAPSASTITEFNIGVAPISLNAYGRKARARMLGATQELEEDRRLSGAFDPAGRPAIFTIEARMSF